MLSKSHKLPYKTLIFNSSVIRCFLTPIQFFLNLRDLIYFVAYFKGFQASIKEDFTISLKWV